jgi:hypothetical protein
MTKDNCGTRGGALLLALAGAAALGCSGLNAPLYFQGETITAEGNDEIVPTSGVKLRFRDPTERERMELDARRQALGYDMDIPWVSRDKVHIEITYKVTNTSDTSGSFALWVDGANEFTQYDVQAASDALGGDDPIFFPLITTTPPRTLEPGASFSGFVREDDFAEGELDLDALGRWNDVDPASPTFAGVLINRSEVNAIGLGLLPGGVTVDYASGRRTLNEPGRLVVPAMIQIDVRLRTTVGMQCEYLVRVRDDDDRLLHNDADTLFEPSPALFQPAALM